MPRRALLFIHLFLAVQVIVPLGYYAGRRDRYDERFAWRMFSPQRMVTCQAAIRIGNDARPVVLGSVFHEAWLSFVERGRTQVVEAMAAKLCHDHPNTAVRVEYTCTPLEGGVVKLGQGGWDLCKTGAL